MRAAGRLAASGQLLACAVIVKRVDAQTRAKRLGPAGPPRSRRST
jgi:hypothetical protein